MNYIKKWRVFNNFRKSTKFSSRYLTTEPRLKLSRLPMNDDLEVFLNTLPRFLSKLIDYSKQHDTTDATAWFEKCLRYHLIEETPYRGYLTYYGFQKLADESQLTEENLELARLVGWCNKMFETVFHITDDITDGSTKRLNQPCWHTLPEVKLQFANDIALMTYAVGISIRCCVGHKEYYPKLLNTFFDCSFANMYGQSLCTLYSRLNLEDHTKEKYDHVVELKASSVGTWAPVVIAMIMSGHTDPNMYQNAKEITYEIGRFWQAKNEYLDCYSKTTTISQTDIEENKLTWLSVNFMKVADAEQRRQIKESYGKQETHHIEQVKSLYDAVGLSEMFLEYEAKTLKSINQMIEHCPYEKLKPVLAYHSDKLFFEYEKS